MTTPLCEAFITTGLWPHRTEQRVPRTIFDNDKTRHFYDQTAWFSDPDGKPLLQEITYTQRAGSFDVIPHIMTGLTRTEISWPICDHYPFWTLFRLRESWTVGIPWLQEQPVLIGFQGSMVLQVFRRNHDFYALPAQVPQRS